jgi:hypothetical protein
METQMKAASHGRLGAAVPKRRQKHHSYDESVDEPAELIEDEAVDIEEAVPLEENEPVESANENADKQTPAFED